MSDGYLCVQMKEIGRKLEMALRNGGVLERRGVARGRSIIS
jgi:hypothetical protein